MNERNTPFARFIESRKGLLLFGIIALLIGLLLMLLQAGGLIVTEDGDDIFGYVVGGILVFCGLGLLSLVALQTKAHRLAATAAAEQRRLAEENGGDSPVLRTADGNAKHRVLAKTKCGGRAILYRRVGRTNELVIDGFVYDEYIALLEFDHSLLAILDGHTIEAGLSGTTSYIMYDNRVIARELRRS